MSLSWILIQTIKLKSEWIFDIKKFTFKKLYYENSHTQKQRGSKMNTHVPITQFRELSTILTFHL